VSATYSETPRDQSPQLARLLYGQNLRHQKLGFLLQTLSGGCHARRFTPDSAVTEIWDRAHAVVLQIGPASLIVGKNYRTGLK
jgi:hypothetical protein